MAVDRCITVLVRDAMHGFTPLIPSIFGRMILPTKLMVPAVMLRHEPSVTFSILVNG